MSRAASESTISPARQSSAVEGRCERLLGYERDLGLLRHRLDGWAIWPLFRFGLAYATTVVGTRSLAGSSPPHSRGELVRLACGDVLRFTRRQPRGGALVVTSSSYKTERDDRGRPMDWLFDELALNLPGAVKAEKCNNRRLFDMDREASVPRAFADAVPSLLSTALLSRLPVPADIAAVAADFQRDLAGMPEAKHIDHRSICHVLIAFRRTKALWRLFLRRLKPKVVLIDDGYGSHGLVAAAREGGATVVELQHGVFFADSPEYRWSEDAVQHADQLPLPQHLLVFGEHWRGLLANDPYWARRCHATGNPRIDKYRQIRNARIAGGEPSRHRLIVTTQGFEQDGICQWLGDVATQMEGDDPGLEIVVKLHPAGDHPAHTYVERLRQHSCIRVEAGDAGQSTLELLATSRFHASVHSTCHYEAVGLGLDTFILPFGPYGMMRPMADKGHAILPESPADMAQRMRRPGATGHDMAAGTHYFAEGATRNAVAVLADLGLAA